MKCFKPVAGFLKYACFRHVHDCVDLHVSNSLIIHDEKTKEINTVKEVQIRDPNYHKIQ